MKNFSIRNYNISTIFVVGENYPLLVLGKTMCEPKENLIYFLKIG